MSNDVVVIIGGCGRIGQAVAQGVVGRGGMAAIVDTQVDTCHHWTSEFDPSFLMVLEADITSPASFDGAIAAVMERYGAISSYVHSAYPRSADWGEPFETVDADSLGWNLFGQLGGAILACQRIAAVMREQQAGSIVLLSSIQGVSAPKFDHYEGTSMTSPIEYTAIKAGILGVTRWLAKYLKDDGIRVNSVSPGGIADGQPSAFVDRYREACSSKGLLDAEDVAGSVLFLTSDSSRYMTGQNLVVDDGWSL